MPARHGSASGFQSGFGCFAPGFRWAGTRAKNSWWIGSATLDLALHASGCDQVHVARKPRLLSELPVIAPPVRATTGDGSSYVSGELAEWLQDKGMKYCRGAPYHLLPGRRCLHRREGPDTRQDRALAPNAEEPHPTGKLLPAWRPRSPGRRLRRSLQSPAIRRELEQRHTRRRLLRARQSHSTAPLLSMIFANHLPGNGMGQKKDAQNATLASQPTRRIIKPTR
jgi:hypothetical protein